MKFTEDHEWLRVEGDYVVVGITKHASEQLGDVVFVELPEPETKVAMGDECAVIESVKAASDILAPVDGEIVAVNEKLTDSPASYRRSVYRFLFRNLNDPLLEALDELVALLKASA